MVSRSYSLTDLALPSARCLRCLQSLPMLQPWWGLPTLVCWQGHARIWTVDAMTHRKDGGSMRGRCARVAPGRTPRCDASPAPHGSMDTKSILTLPCSFTRCTCARLPLHEHVGAVVTAVESTLSAAMHMHSEASRCAACRWSGITTFGATAAGTATATCAARTWRRRACGTSATPSRSTACQRAAGSTRTEGTEVSWDSASQPSRGACVRQPVG